MTGNRRLALALVLVLVGAAFVAPTGLAQEDPNETDEENETEEDEAQEEANETDEEQAEDEEREGDEEERSVEIETEGKDVSIELERETEPREDKVEMTWKAEEASFELAYESENASRETEDKLEATFGAVAEYRDENDNGRYDAGEEIVSGWTLGDEREDEMGLDQRAEWGQPTIDDVTHEGEDGKRIVSTATLGDSGELTLRFLVFGDFVELNGTSLSPTGAKIDIVVEDYSFAANDTELALFLETETESEFEQDVDDEEGETGVSARNASDEAGPRLVFTWKDTAQVDGETRDVETTVLEEETESETDDGEAEHETKRAFVLSYPRGSEIVHDPRAEVLIQSGAGADVPGFGVPTGLAALAGLALVVDRRRRGRA